AEELPVLGEGQAPGVVVGAAEEFELGDDRDGLVRARSVSDGGGARPSLTLRALKFQLEPVVPLAELQLLAVHLAVKPAVADAAVNPVVEPVVQVARPGVRVLGAPAGEEDLPQVGLAVAVGVL